MNFNDLYWHDAIIKNISIDRNNPGNLDEIIFTIRFPDMKKDCLFTFKNVYWLNMSLNFGIVTEETVLNAFESEQDDEDLSNLYLKWKGLINNIELKIFTINLNSTGGKIKIISKEFDLISL